MNMFHITFALRIYSLRLHPVVASTSLFHIPAVWRLEIGGERRSKKYHSNRLSVPPGSGCCDICSLYPDTLRLMYGHQAWSLIVTFEPFIPLINKKKLCVTNLLSLPDILNEVCLHLHFVPLPPLSRFQTLPKGSASMEIRSQKRWGLSMTAWKPASNSCERRWRNNMEQSPW